MTSPTPLHRLAAISLLGLAALGGATVYWGFVRADELAARPDNPRRIEFDRRIRRGAIVDRFGTILARTNFDGGQPVREYPIPAAAPVTGFQTWQYGAGTFGRAYGAGGAEAAYDLALRGDLGLGPRDLLASRLLHRPQTGLDVRLTIDAGLQESGATLLAGREGAVVVVAVASGEVRALVSWPTFDPAALDAAPADEEDPSRPMLNRATQGLYPPGSTWKTVTLAAALAEGLTSLSDVVDDGNVVEHFDGFPVACNNNPRDVTSFDIAHAYGWSCNVTFARLGARLGAETYGRYAEGFGTGASPPFALAAAEGSLSADDSLELPELASAAFGQGELLVTPLQMALVTAAIAGDGTLPLPLLLDGVVGHRSSLGETRGPWRRAVDPGTAQAVREAMAISVREGWARSAVAGLEITAGGKTGTAQVASGAPHSWFIGFAPADDPVVAVSVIVVHGGEGSAVAAPIGGRILAEAVRREAVPTAGR